MSGYRIHVPPANDLHRKEIELRVKMLREVVCTHERWFNTPKEVIDYLNDIGVRSTYGRLVSYQLLRKFVNKMGFPWPKFTKTRQQLVCSNVLIMAWLWSLRVYKCTRSRFPNTGDLADAVAHLL